MRDQQDRLAAGGGEDVPHQLFCRLGVEMRGRLVEDEKRGVDEKCSGEHEPLALPARQSRPFLADERVEAEGEVATHSASRARRSAPASSSSVAAGRARRRFSRIVELKTCAS